jgi:hypothetical protein
MSEAAKLCPEFSTAQVLVSEVVFQAQGQAGMSLAGISGVPSASAPAVTNGKAVFVHKDPILPDGAASSGKIDISKISRFRGQPISVPCILGKCAKWCEKHDARDCAAGCQECNLEVATQAFATALEAQSDSLGLASARKLLDKAHGNLEEQET